MSVLEDARYLVRKNRIIESLKFLEKSIVDITEANSKEYRNEIILLQSRYNNINHFLHSQLITIEEYQTNLNKLVISILKLIDYFEDEIHKTKKNKTELCKLTLNENFDTFSEEDIQTLIAKIQSLLKLNPNELIIHNVKPGSVIIIFEVNQFKLKQLTSLITLSLINGKLELEDNNSKWNQYINSYFELIPIDLSDTDLSNAELNNIKLDEGNFENTNFSESKIANCSFRFGNLKNASFKNALLNAVDFSNSNLTDADFENIKGENITFKETKFEGYDERFFKSNRLTDTLNQMKSESKFLKELNRIYDEEIDEVIKYLDRKEVRNIEKIYSLLDKFLIVEEEVYKLYELNKVMIKEVKHSLYADFDYFLLDLFFKSRWDIQMSNKLKRLILVFYGAKKRLNLDNRNFRQINWQIEETIEKINNQSDFFVIEGYNDLAEIKLPPT